MGGYRTRAVELASCRSTMATPSTSAWLSLVVKRSTTIVVPRKIVNVSWASSFGELMIAADGGLEQETVDKVIISTNESFF